MQVCFCNQLKTHTLVVIYSHYLGNDGFFVLCLRMMCNIYIYIYILNVNCAINDENTDLNTKHDVFSYSLVKDNLFSPSNVYLQPSGYRRVYVRMVNGQPGRESQHR